MAPAQLPLFVVLFLLCTVSTFASLMAVDLGGNFLKVSVVQPGRKPISIAENEMSKRQTPVMVGFVDGQRIMGEDAVTVSGRHPDKFIEHLRDLIGRRADDPSVQHILSNNFRHYEIVPDTERGGTILLRIPGNDHLFSIEEIMVSR
jgi:hypoxia up-regulated 1